MNIKFMIQSNRQETRFINDMKCSAGNSIMNISIYYEKFLCESVAVVNTDWILVTGLDELDRYKLIRENLNTSIHYQEVRCTVPLVRDLDVFT